MRFRTILAALAAVALLLAAGGASAAAAPAAPQLGLRAATDSVVLWKYGRDQPVYLDLGVYLQSLGADFQLNVTRRYGHPIRVSQQLGSSQRALPGWVADGWNGMAHLVTYKIQNAEGSPVATIPMTICPNSYDVQRVDPNGTGTPHFPQFCSSNPFTLGTVWGIDQGWAVPLVDSAPFIRLPQGTYTITIRINHRYRELFGIPRSLGAVHVTATVKLAGKNGCPPYCGAAAHSRVNVAAARRLANLAPADVPTQTSPDPATVPDLIALPAWGIQISHHRHRDYIDFGATVWDRGPAPMVVEGFRRPGTDIMDAYQYFYRDGQIVGKAPAGTLVYDAAPGHEHWHFEQFARYALLSGDRREVVRSRKDGFCLAPTDAIDLTVPNAVYNPDSIGFFGACGDATSIWTRETLPVGWGDTYFQGLPGQSFNITNLPNGTYYVEVQANPLHALHEVSTHNDTRLRRVILGGVPGHRTIRIPPWKGIDA